MRSADAVGNVSNVASASVTLQTQYEDPVVEAERARAYVEDHGTDIATATAWMRVQDRADSLGEAITSTPAADGYGGVWVDNATRKVTINLTPSTNAAPVTDLLQQRGLLGDATIRRFAHTQAQLDEARPALDSALADLSAAGKIELSRDPTTQSIEVQVATSASAADRARIAAAAAASPVAVTTVDVPEPNLSVVNAGCKFGNTRNDALNALGEIAACTAPLRGGTTILNESRRCTSAFNARRGPDRVLLTAGHCIGEGGSGLWAGARPFSGEIVTIGNGGADSYDNNNGDAGYITVSPNSPWVQGITPRPWVFVTKTSDTLTPAVRRLMTSTAAPLPPRAPTCAGLAVSTQPGVARSTRLPTATKSSGVSRGVEPQRATAAHPCIRRAPLEASS